MMPVSLTEKHHDLSHLQFVFIPFLSAIAEVYKNEGNEEYRKKDFKDAIYFYTEGIKVKCQDDELNAKLHSNRAIAHFYLGETIFLYDNCTSHLGCPVPVKITDIL